MFKTCLTLICLLFARAAAADTMVTWQSSGQVTLSQYLGFTGTPFTPPIGTPYQLTLSFNPAAVKPTDLASNPTCNSVAVTGSMNLGGYNYGLSGKGYTHAMLPGTTCSPGWFETQFLIGVASPADSPWKIKGGFMEAWYSDLLVRDTFPNAPTPVGSFGWQMRDDVSSPTFLVMAKGSLSALADPVQPTPVPEPGTITLLGLGIALAANKIRRRDRE